MYAINAFTRATLQQQQQQQWGFLVGYQQHTAVVIPQQPAFAYITCIAMNASAIASNGFTYTYLQPSLRSQTAGCIVPVDFMLTITGMTQDGQWYSLDTLTWIPSAWIHGLQVYH
jgi:hypothetical protein